MTGRCWLGRWERDGAFVYTESDSCLWLIMTTKMHSCYVPRAQGSSAALDGRLAVGDRILKIDGFHVDRASYEGAVALLRTTDDLVMFEVARDESAEHRVEENERFFHPKFCRPWGTKGC